MRHPKEMTRRARGPAVDQHKIKRKIVNIINIKSTDKSLCAARLPIYSARVVVYWSTSKREIVFRLLEEKRLKKSFDINIVLENGGLHYAKNIEIR